MTTMSNCTIKLLNKTYALKCPEGEEANLLLVAAKINEKMLENKHKFKRADDFQALLLASLDIGHELLLSKSAQEEQRHQVTEFISSLESKINKAVSGELHPVRRRDRALVNEDED